MELRELREDFYRLECLVENFMLQFVTNTEPRLKQWGN